MFKIWIQAITGPTEDNYLNIVKNNNPSAGTAALWMIIAGVIGGIIGGVTAGSTGILAEFPVEEAGFGVVALAVILAIIYPIGIIISFFLGSGLYFVISKALGGTGSFSEQSYLMAAASAPLNILVAITGAIPLVGVCIAPFIGLYSFFLNLLSIKTAHQLSWGKVVAVALILVIMLFVVSCGVIVILTLLGDQVGAVFEDVSRELEGTQ